MRSQDVKARSRSLTALFEAFEPPGAALVGHTVRAWFSEIAADGTNLVGHTKSYVQVLVSPEPGLLGCSALVHVRSASRWSVMGEVMRVVTRPSPVAVQRSPSVREAGKQLAAAATGAAVGARSSSRAASAAACGDDCACDCASTPEAGTVEGQQQQRDGAVRRAAVTLLVLGAAVGLAGMLWAGWRLLLERLGKGGRWGAPGGWLSSGGDLR